MIPDTLVRKVLDADRTGLGAALRDDGYSPQTVVREVLEARAEVGPTPAQIEAGAKALWAETNADTPWPPTSDGTHAYGIPGPVLEAVVTAFRLRSELVLRVALNEDVTS